MNFLRNPQSVIPLSAFAMISSVFVMTSCSMMSSNMASDEGPAEETDTASAADTGSIDDYYKPLNVGTDDDPAELIPSTENDPSCESNANRQYSAVPPSGSTASAQLARFAIDRGSIPSTPIRESEFLNYYAPFSSEADSPQLFVQATPVTDSSKGEIELKFAFSIPEAETRPPLNLVLAVDTSASMEGTGIEIAKSVCLATFDSLTAGDVVSIVTWNTAVTAQISILSFTTDEAEAACGTIASEAQTATDIRAGLTGAYDAANLFASTSLHNHVLFISDGGAAAGFSDKQFVEVHTTPEDESAPIYLSTLGTLDTALFPSRYHDNLMKMLADAGGGAHYFADSAKEGLKILENRFFPRIGVAARSAAFTLSVPPQFEALGESEGGSGSNTNQEPSENRFDLPPGSAMLFHEILSPCESEVGAVQIEAENGFEDAVSWSLSYVSQMDQAPQTITVQPQADNSASASGFLKAGIVLLFTDALRSAKSGDKDAAGEQIELALSTIGAAEPEAQNDPDIVEIGNLLIKTKKLL